MYYDNEIDYAHEIALQIWNKLIPYPFGPRITPLVYIPITIFSSILKSYFVHYPLTKDLLFVSELCHTDRRHDHFYFTELSELVLFIQVAQDLGYV